MASLTIERPQTRPTPDLARRAYWRSFIPLVVVGDAAALLAAFVLTSFIRFDSGLPFFDDVPSSPESLQQLIVFLIPLWMIILALFQLYDIHNLLGGTQEYARVFNACSFASILTVLLTFFVPVIRLSRGWMAMAWVLAFFALITARFGLRRFAYHLRRRGLFTSRTLIVGTDDEACAIANQLENNPSSGVRIVGFVSNHAAPGPHMPEHPAIVGCIDSLPTLVQTMGIEEVIVSTATLPRSDLLTIFETFGHSDQVELRFSSGLYELFTTGVRVNEIGSIPLVSMNKVRLDGFESCVKRLLDLSASLLGLFVLLPVFALIAFLIKRDSPGPIIHRRRVLGRGGSPFDAFKFRTMYVNGDEILKRHPELAQELKSNFKLKQDPRITHVGAVLRRISFDEFPQLLNVLRGQMSLVGPRMITPEEGEKYGRLRMNLLTVKPGMTGLWQISGRSDVGYDERVRLDMHYVRNYSIWLDLQILLQTIPVVLRGKGAY